MARRKSKGPRYQVVDGTSTRVSIDPEDPGYNEWRHWEAGDVATEWPDHADVAGWVESGHWVLIEEKA